MPSIKGRFEYSDGLTPGRSKDGGLHQNLYDGQGRLVDHGTFIPDDENEEDPLTDPPPVFIYVTDENSSDSRSDKHDDLAEAISDLVELLILVAEAYPHVKRWWNKALPIIKSQWNRLSRTRVVGSQPATDEASTVGEATVIDSSQEVVTLPDVYRVSMSSAEARACLLLALVAKAFSEEQVRIVSNVHIKDDDGLVELKRTVGELIPQQIANIVKALRANPSFLDDETLAELGNILGRDERNIEMLCLTGPEKRLRSLE
ncbi:hypothetical protein [Streptomyces sp. NBC_01198]|uniref:hypothetical protein n=1 Tax=Streptomyces sp. NBC_01198 TaxID=2903769 RepID=UPI002E0DA535|nr:hypothetical protein OG702_00050 [Streptomyces sp. NBC_01198]WSR66431.1 hypothetical protein OG702_35310 [Streptomyces sp. NBC_01198]